MFNIVVPNNNCFTDVIAESFFSDKIIDGGQISFQGRIDYSLLATSRALLAPRLDYDEKIYVGSRFIGETSMSRLKDYLTASISDDIYDSGSHFRVFVIDSGMLDACHQIIRDSSRFREIERVQQFLSKYFPCSVWVSEENHISYLFMEVGRSPEMQIRHYHAAQTAILTAHPWLFNPEVRKETLTDDEKELITALADGSYDNYMSALTRIADAMNFRQEILKQCIERFERNLLNTRQRDIEHELIKTKDRIDDVMSILMRTIEDRRRLQLEFQAIQLGIAQEGNSYPLKDFISGNDQIELKNVTDSKIDFWVKTYLSDWTEAALDNAIHNRNSVMFDEVPESKQDDAELLYTAIFETRKIKVRTVGAFAIKDNGNLIALDNQAEFIPKDYMPNPHIDKYHCLGGYEPDIAQAMFHGDKVYAMEIAIVAAGNINFEDSWVMHDWTRDLFERDCFNRKCFELPDGSCVTITEAINWLKGGQ